MSNPFAADTSTPTPAPTPTPVPPPIVHAAATNGGPVAGGSVSGAASTGNDDPFSGPAPQRPKGPRLRELYGRLLLITPKLVETVPNRKAKDGSTQQRMTCDVVVLDGEPIAYGGRPEATPPTQHYLTAQVPHRTRDQFISAVGLVSQCADALERRKAGKSGMVLGRLGVGEARDSDSNPPYLLSEATDADKEIARRYLATIDPFA